MSNECERSDNDSGYWKKEYTKLVVAVVDFANDKNIRRAMETKHNREAFTKLRHVALISNAAEMMGAGGMVSPEDTPGGKDEWVSILLGRRKQAAGK